MSNEPFKWDDEAFSLLDEKLKSGASRAMIAAAFTEHFGRQFTKGSISGAVDRRWPDRSFKVREGQPLMTTKGRNRPTITKKKQLTKVIAMPRAAPTLHDIATCKWIDGEVREDYTICGQPAALKSDGSPKAYCPHHCSIAYLKPRERSAERELVAQ